MIPAGSKTLPDVTMESLASSFDEHAAEDEQLRQQNMRPTSLSSTSRHGLEQLDETGEETPTHHRTGRQDLREGHLARSQKEGSHHESPPPSKRWLAVGNVSEDMRDTSQTQAALDKTPEWDLSNDNSVNIGQPTSEPQGSLQGRAGKLRHSIATSAANDTTIIRDSTGQPQLSLRQQEAETDRIKKENFDLKFELEMLRTQLANGVGVEKAQLMQQVGELQRNNASLKGDMSKFKKASRSLNETVIKLDNENQDLRNQLAAAADPETVIELEERLNEELDARQDLEARLDEALQELQELKHNRPSDESLDQIEVSQTRSFLLGCGSTRSTSHVAASRRKCQTFEHG